MPFVLFLNSSQRRLCSIEFKDLKLAMYSQAPIGSPAVLVKKIDSCDTSRISR